MLPACAGVILEAVSCAGVILLQQTPLRKILCASRVCGGDPNQFLIWQSKVKCFPRVRG